ncbi:MAG: UDP-N-acetylmuramoyl-L-alanine--D-glutamate ligase, partial [Candidatus Woesebacteria bacterium]|nr:UDP-N-acetylmuramoyl-L-alanine--D-glutamate ligase [Candidatus Woesebacteria bacterium]
MNYINKKVAIIGYGLEGQDVEKFLKSKEAKVTILDQKFDKNYLSNLEKFDLIVRSPGVYPYKKELIKASKNGIRITTPTHIFLDEFNGKVIAVTGTKGKGTTSTLIYEILKKAKFDVFLGGNIGKPLLELLSKLKSSSYVVMEISSFQLIDLPVSPDIAVILNITLDHLDWHENKEEYIEAKKNIVKYQKTSDWAIINKEYKVSSSFARETKANIMYFSKKTLKNEFKKDLTLRGEHNLENIAAAVSVSKVLNIDEKIILKVVRRFKGLEHRLEFVRKLKGIKFYNDSFATGPQSTIAAINSFTEDETLILGGSDKGLDYLELGKIISKR